MRVVRSWRLCQGGKLLEVFANVGTASCCILVCDLCMPCEHSTFRADVHAADVALIRNL